MGELGFDGGGHEGKYVALLLVAGVTVHAPGREPLPPRRSAGLRVSACYQVISRPPLNP